MELETIRDNVKSVLNRFDDLLIQTIEENEVYINELIRLQLQQGQRGDGQLITPTYSKPYAQKKGITVPNLKVSGKFYSDIYVEKVTVEYIVHDSDTKTRKGFELGQHLQKRYTEKILQLTPQSLIKLENKVFTEFTNKVYNEIFR